MREKWIYNQEKFPINWWITFRVTKLRTKVQRRRDRCNETTRYTWVHTKTSIMLYYICAAINVPIQMIKAQRNFVCVFFGAPSKFIVLGNWLLKIPHMNFHFFFFIFNCPKFTLKSWFSLLAMSGGSYSVCLWMMMVHYPRRKSIGLKPGYCLIKVVRFQRTRRAMECLLVKRPPGVWLVESGHKFSIISFLSLSSTLHIFFSLSSLRTYIWICVHEKITTSCSHGTQYITQDWNK